MDFANSLKWVTEFWKNNQALVEQIQQAGDASADIENVADALQKSQEQATQLAAALATKFQVAPDDATKQCQSGLIKRIQSLNETIQEFRDPPKLLPRCWPSAVICIWP